jgi:hypothetical protein
MNVVSLKGPGNDDRECQKILEPIKENQVFIAVLSR